MRAGGATTALDNDIDGDLMDIHGRWLRRRRSERSKKGYIEKKRLSVTQS